MRFLESRGPAAVCHSGASAAQSRVLGPDGQYGQQHRRQVVHADLPVDAEDERLLGR